MTDHADQAVEGRLVPQPGALELLHQQHLDVEALFAELGKLQLAAESSEVSFLEQRRLLMATIVRELSVHSGIEEEHFYPEVARCAGEEFERHAVDEHQQVKELLNALDTMSPDNIDFQGLLHQLMADVREHVHYEETEIFPKIRDALSESQLETLGVTLRKAMKTAPTRPHPRTPPATSGLGRVAAKGAAKLDRLRDRAEGR